MSEPNHVARAVMLARRLHQGQRDKAGWPYHMHLERTAHRLIELFPDVTVTQIQAAILHDAIEDEKITADGLLDEGITPPVIAIVQRLARPPQLPYLDWVRSLAASGDVGAIRVKLADVLDNADTLWRPDFPGRAEMLVEKYMPAVPILAAAIGLDPDEVWSTPYPKMSLRNEDDDGR